MITLARPKKKIDLRSPRLRVAGFSMDDGYDNAPEIYARTEVGGGPHRTATSIWTRDPPAIGKCVGPSPQHMGTRNVDSHRDFGSTPIAGGQADGQ